MWQPATRPGGAGEHPGHRGEGQTGEEEGKGREGWRGDIGLSERGKPWVEGAALVGLMQCCFFFFVGIWILVNACRSRKHNAWFHFLV